MITKRKRIADLSPAPAVVAEAPIARAREVNLHPLAPRNPRLALRAQACDFGYILVSYRRESAMVKRLEEPTADARFSPSVANVRQDIAFKPSDLRFKPRFLALGESLISGIRLPKCDQNSTNLHTTRLNTEKNA